jgi:phosphate transport system protein
MMNGKETQLQQMLTRLRTRLLVMSASVGIAVDEACAALIEGNMGRASAVIDGDEAINFMENEIDELALALLARNQPVAQDLRFVIASLRMVLDLERIGDEAASIAERVLIMHAPLPQVVMGTVNELMHSASTQYKGAVESFRSGDPEMALKLARNDDETTQQEVAALQNLMDYLCFSRTPEHERGIGQSYASMHGILICRALNRICRRSANIAEHAYFVAKGVNLKHKKGA